MKTTSKKGWPLAVLFLLTLPASPGLDGQTSESSPLRLDEVLVMARERSPRYRAALARVDASVAREAGAGILPDPTVQVGVMNLALPELSPDMPASMAPSFQAMQSFPLAGKLSLRGDVARQSTDIQRATAEETWWQVRTEAASSFYSIYETERRLEVLRETLELLTDFEDIARSMYASGSGRQADVLRASVEVSRTDAEIQRLHSRRVAAVSRLNALLNRPAETPIPETELGVLSASTPEPSTVMGIATEGRPLLRGFQAEVERAGTRTELARKAIWPDLTVGIHYGLGRMNGDVKGMGGASVGFSLPLFAGKRQLRARDEAAANESLARARYDEVRAMVNAGIIEVLADLEQTRSLITLYGEEILPQAEAAVESSLASYRAGIGDFMTLVDAQMAVNQFRSEYYGLLARYGTDWAVLEMTLGRDLPVTDEMLLEAP
jgi:outer membrane protein TolC